MMIIIVSIAFLLVKYLNAHTGIVFLRFPKKFYRLLWSALPFITGIETRGQKIPCFFNCLHVGGEENLNTHTVPFIPAALKVFVILGTIRTCQKFLIQYNKRQLHRMLPKCKNKGKSWFGFFKCRIFSYFECDWVWYSFCRRGKRGAQSDPELFSNRRKGI